MDYGEHVRAFEENARLRAGQVESWPTGGWLDPAVTRSLQRFQVGEDGDGACLIGKSERAGDPLYVAAVRLFVAEEQNHARLLENLLAYAGEPTISGHWTDAVFVAVRRAMGLRLELMTLTVAEVVALRYYRALLEGTDDALVAEVARRILADEERHVPFQVDRLRDGFRHTPSPARLACAAGWWVLMVGATLVVAADHGAALRRLRVTRRRFVSDVIGLFRPLVSDVFFRGGRQSPDMSPTPRIELDRTAAGGRGETSEHARPAHPARS